MVSAWSAPHKKDYEAQEPLHCPSVTHAPPALAPGARASAKSYMPDAPALPSNTSLVLVPPRRISWICGFAPAAQADGGGVVLRIGLFDLYVRYLLDLAALDHGRLDRSLRPGIHRA